MRNMYLIDTREQRPFLLQPSKRTKLDVGDYTTVKLRKKFCIERKSLIDLYGSITRGHLRFKQELIRAKISSIELVVFVEGTKKDFKEKKFFQGDIRKVEGDTLIKIIESITLRHGTVFKWYKNRNLCRLALIRLLKQKEKQWKL